MPFEKIAVGYCRLSDKDSSANSIANQKRRIEDYCQRHHLQLLQIFVDDGRTGWNFDRPGFIEMERFCRTNSNIQYLIIPHFDRFSRADPVDAMVKERYIREKLGVKVLQVSEPIDTDTTAPTYQIIRFMQAFAANEERNRIVDRTMSGMRFSLLQGRYCSNAPYGYKNTRDENGRPLLVVDDEKAFVIKMIFREYLAGSGAEEIRRRAEKQGLKLTGKSAIQRILANPVYAGLVRVPAYRDQPEKIVKAIHSPLVTETVYWQIQELLGGKRHSSQPKEEVPLRGVLRCSCGRKMTAAPSQGKSGKHYWYYFCESHRKKNLSAIKIHAQFYDLLDNLSLSADTLSWLKDELTSAINRFIQERGSNLMQTRHAVGKINQKIEATEEKFLLQPDLSQATFKKVMTGLKAEKSKLEKELASLEQNTQIYWDRMNTLLPALHDLRTVWEKMPLDKKHKFIRAVFEDSLAYTDGVYRTPSISPIFQHNLLKLKQKRLLEVEQPIDNFGKTESSPPGGTFLELVSQLAVLFAA